MSNKDLIGVACPTFTLKPRAAVLPFYDPIQHLLKFADDFMLSKPPHLL